MFTIFIISFVPHIRNIYRFRVFFRIILYHRIQLYRWLRIGTHHYVCIAYILLSSTSAYARTKLYVCTVYVVNSTKHTVLVLCTQLVLVLSIIYSERTNLLQVLMYQPKRCSLFITLVYTVMVLHSIYTTKLILIITIKYQF